jgi:Flp pilus assembly pilin Flp
VTRGPTGRWSAHRVWSLLARLGREDKGQDLLEYALLTGIIAIAGILVFPAIQASMADAYQDWNDSAQAIWIPPPPM